MNAVVGALEGIAGAGTATLGYSLLEAQAFTVRQVTTQVLPKGSADLRVLHLSDLHITPAQTRKIKWVKSLIELQPDLVVVTGDFLAHKLAVPAVVEALGELLDIPGLFVLGSNDYYEPHRKNPFIYFNKNRRGVTRNVHLPTSDLVEQLTDAGWHDLNNKQTEFVLNGIAIHARGTDDAHIKKDKYAKVAGAFSENSFALGVTHAPYQRVLQSFSKDNADIVLAGHTHGGQICIPFYGALVTNCDLPTTQAKGLSTFGENDMPLHVSAGIGTSPFTQIRFACRPEATVLTMKARAE